MIEKKAKTGISVSTKLLAECDEFIAKNKKIQSRSELIETAVSYYLAMNNVADKSEILVPELAKSIAKASDDGITKISKGLFRYAVEVEMLIELLAETVDVSENQLEIIRKNAIKNCRRTRGKLNLDDLILRNQREGYDDYEEENNDENS